MDRKKNPDWWFAAATMKHVKDFAVLMEQNNVAITDKDNKAHIPLGIPAANKQYTILITMEYHVTLPDHTFIFSNKHKLAPSGYATREVKEGSLTCSRLTHAVIPSLKHDKTDVFSFMEDLKHVIGENGTGEYV